MRQNLEGCGLARAGTLHGRSQWWGGRRKSEGDDARGRTARGTRSSEPALCTSGGPSNPRGARRRRMSEQRTAHMAAPK